MGIEPVASSPLSIPVFFGIIATRLPSKGGGALSPNGLSELNLGSCGPPAHAASKNAEPTTETNAAQERLRCSCGTPLLLRRVSSFLFGMPAGAGPPPQWPGVTDASVDVLLAWPDLEWLNIAGTSISPAGRERLLELEKLSELSRRTLAP